MTVRTEECRSVAEYDPYYLGFTVETPLTFSTVDLEGRGEASSFPGGRPIVPQRSAPGPNGVTKNFPDTRQKGFGFTRSQASGRSPWVNPTQEEGLGSVDVSDSGDSPLVQEPGPDGGSGSLEGPVKSLRRELSSKGFGAESLGFRFPFRRRIDSKKAEPPYVCVIQ